ncbi:hypothetical protein PWT90_09372 [Aphanocladium album]|nr:hypothetical protein PWT90_09372 [Aphanocladium album]
MDFYTRFEDAIARSETVIGHTFRDKPLCAEALNNGGPTASVYIANGQYLRLPKNDRLAVYATWTSMRNDMLCNDHLAQVGFTLGLNRNINKDTGTTSVSKKMMATAVEAILGAVHLDGGDVALRRVMAQLRLASPCETLVLFQYLFFPMFIEI